MADYTISKLAAAGGVGVETVRFYQRRGLLSVPAEGNGIRRYAETDVRRLRFIRSAQSAGFTLEEIARLLECDALNDREKVRKLASVRLAALTAEIEQLNAARKSLSRLVHDCTNKDAGPCPILEAFDA